jgi:hypothetical protein
LSQSSVKGVRDLRDSGNDPWQGSGRPAWEQRPMNSSEPRPSLRLENAINTSCPWSGKPIQPDSLTTYRGAVVGFCNPGCRDKFAAAQNAFEAKLPK